MNAPWERANRKVERERVEELKKCGACGKFSRCLRIHRKKNCKKLKEQRSRAGPQKVAK